MHSIHLQFDFRNRLQNLQYIQKTHLWVIVEFCFEIQRTPKESNDRESQWKTALFDTTSTSIIFFPEVYFDITPLVTYLIQLNPVTTKGKNKIHRFMQKILQFEKVKGKVLRLRNKSVFNHINQHAPFANTPIFDGGKKAAVDIIEGIFKIFNQLNFYLKFGSEEQFGVFDPTKSINTNKYS